MGSVAVPTQRTPAGVLRGLAASNGCVAHSRSSATLARQPASSVETFSSPATDPLTPVFLLKPAW
jgi:hypothetical protein